MDWTQVKHKITNVKYVKINMDNVGMICVHFKEEPLISSIRTETQEVKDSNIAKEALKSKESNWEAKSYL